MARSINRRCNVTKSRGINTPRKAWSKQEDDLLRAFYPWTTGPTLARYFGCSTPCVYSRAYFLDLEKSQWFKDGPLGKRLRRGGTVGADTRFKKGQVPFNKGIKGISYPGSVATQFKPGQKPQTWKPIGSERLTKDGYIQVKMSDTGYPPRDWVGKQIIIWERLHGMKLPDGHMVIFRDGNQLNFNFGNLQLMSRAENMKRNSYHNYGPEIARLFQLKGAIKRQINKRKESK